MDGNLAMVYLGCLVFTAFLIVAIAAPQMLWSLGSWRYRNAEAMEPSPRQYRLRRVHSASLLALVVPPLVAIPWPGDFRAKLAAWAVASIALIVIVLAITVTVWLVMRRRFAASDDRDPSELSELGYSVEWGQVAYTFVYVIVIVVIVMGASTTVDREAEERAERSTHTLTPQQVQAIKDAMPAPPVVVEARREPPLVAEVPEGSVVDDPRSSVTGDDGSFRVIVTSSDCVPSGLLVVEGPDTVGIGVVYPVADLDLCTFRDYNHLDVLIVPLAAPLGDRTPERLDGTGLIYYEAD